MAEESKADKKKPAQKQSKTHKRLIQSEKHRIANKATRTKIKTTIKSFHSALDAKDMEKSAAFLNEASSLVDKATKKGVFKLNKASRVKSQLTAYFRKAQSTL